MELEAEPTPPSRTWTPVLPVPSETVAVATFQWSRIPLTRTAILRLLAAAVAVVLACSGLAFVVSSMGTATYGARSEILYPITAEIASAGFLRQDRVLATQLVALKSRGVLAPVAAKHHLTVGELSSKVVVSIVQDSEVLRVEVDDPSPALAQVMVGEIATQYLKQSAPKANTATEAYLSGQIAALDRQRTALTGQISDLESRRLANGGAPSSTELQLQADLQSLNNQRSTLETQLSDATVAALQQQHIQQLTQPYLMSGKVSPKPVRSAIAGALAGMLVAAGVIALMLRRRLKQLPLDQHY